jgi:hypothetical protein
LVHNLAIVVGAWLTPKKRARTKLEVMNQFREDEEPLKITATDEDIRSKRADAG